MRPALFVLEKRVKPTDLTGGRVYVLVCPIRSRAHLSGLTNGGARQPAINVEAVGQLPE
jgi:hypothetical protein